MKDNYNIKFNPPQLSTDQIERNKNFDALLEQFNKNAAKKKSANNSKLRYLIFGSVAVAASLAFLLIYRGFFTTQISENQLALKVPFNKIDIGFINYEIDATKGDTLKHESGSIVVVPASAFVDERGNTVSGKVDIKYRELNEAAEKFIAGVPQKAENTVLQSAALMQIQGFKNGKPVFISKDKEIQVELKSVVSTALVLENLKSYNYDSKKLEWQEATIVKTEILSKETGIEKNDSSEFLSEKRFDSNEIAAAIQKKYPKPIKPIQPSKGTPPNMIALGFDINANEFPEIKKYENVDWMAEKSIVEPLPSDGWSNMKVNRIGELKYEIVMIPNDASKKIGRKEVRFEAYPLIPYSNKNFADYKRAMEEYNVAMSRREAQISSDLAQVSNKNEVKIPNQVKEDKKDKFRIQTILSRFSIKEFGMWTAAKPFNMETLPTVKASFKDSNANDFEVAEVFVFDAEKQLYFSSTDKSKLRLDINSEHNQVWVVSNGLLYVADPSPKKDGANIEFILRPASQPKNEQDIINELI